MLGARSLNYIGIQRRTRSFLPLVIWDIVLGEVGFGWRSGGGAITGKTMERVEHLIIFEEKREERLFWKEAIGCLCGAEHLCIIMINHRNTCQAFIIKIFSRRIHQALLPINSCWCILFCIFSDRGHFFFFLRNEGNKMKFTRGLIYVWYFKTEQCHYPRQILSL